MVYAYGVVLYKCLSVFQLVFHMCGSKIDPYGFERPDNFDARIHEEFMSQYLGVLARRAGRWSWYMRGRKRVSMSAKCTTSAVFYSEIYAVLWLY